MARFERNPFRRREHDRQPKEPPEGEPPAETGHRRGSEAVVEAAVYTGGRRVESGPLEHVYEMVRSGRGMGWIGLYHPDEATVASVAAEFDLHPLAVEDALTGHQRSKLERYGETLFCVLRPARYLDSAERVEIGELHLFAGPDFVVTIRRSESPDLGLVRRRLEAQPELLRLGPEAVMHAVLDQVVDDYSPVLAGIDGDLDEIESEVFGGDVEVSRRIYKLGREVIEFHRAVAPLEGMCELLRSGFDQHQVDLELQRLLRDVADHAVRINERVEGYRELLNNMLSVNAAVVAQRQNEEMARITQAGLDQNEAVKKISAWAAILFAPTLVGTIYGMNFRHMPELHWTFGYPLAVTLMVLCSVILYRVMKWRRWF